MSETSNWGLPVQVDGIPRRLARVKRWCTWRAVERGNGKVDKVPHRVHPSGPRIAHVDNPGEGVTLPAAAAQLSADSESGLGFLLKDCPVVVLDFDRCLAGGGSGELLEGKSWVQRLIEDAGSEAWVELSPSGEGLHAWFWLDDWQGLRGWKNHAAGIELLVDGFVTCTGRAWTP